MLSSLLPRRIHQRDVVDLLRRNSSVFTPALLFISQTLSNIGTPAAHSLLIGAIAWAVACLFATATTKRQEKGQVGNSGTARQLAWASGALFALGSVCEKAVGGRGIWWANGLLPMIVYVLLNSSIFASNSTSSVTPPATPDKPRHDASSRSGPTISLGLLTSCAIAATFSNAGSNATIALGLSFAIIDSLALILAERAGIESRNTNGASVIYSANGLLSQPQKTQEGPGYVPAVLPDVAASAAVCTALATMTLESFSFGGLAYRGSFGQVIGEDWKAWDETLELVFAVGMLFARTMSNGSLLYMLQRHGSQVTSFVPLSSSVLSQLFLGFSIRRLWFASLCAVSTYGFLAGTEDQSVVTPRGTSINRIVTVVTIVSFGVASISSLRTPYATFRSGQPSSDVPALDTSQPTAPFAPLAYTDSKVHPIDVLIKNAEDEWAQVLKGQSQSLEQAVAEYRRRYRLPPPPNFDKWYEFAKRKGVQLIDEFDTIHHALQPFWGLSPITIRTRAREAIGYGDNFLMGLLIRDGKMKHVENGPDWLQHAAVGMIESFVQYLPDMDLAFNMHDEPRVVVPHDDLNRLVVKAITKEMPAAFGNASPRNSFSSRPSDVTAGPRIPEAKTTRFNVYAHQPVWLPSRLSCPPQSPARALDDVASFDNLTAYAMSELGFLYNTTAFSDVCNSPSYSQGVGFFQRPNAFNVVHDLVPVFSQSKVSSFQDILYPSPWYWYGKVDYEESRDLDWSKKINAMLWRGSTTGGFSRAGGWRRQHRQHMVKTLNALDKAKILKNTNQGSSKTPNWNIESVPREDYKSLMDVHFQHVYQCDPGDCDAQKEYFGIADSVMQQDHWKWKYLLDMDGNAFSGRFYAFLKSKSLVFKMAVFREWHADWLKPWVHFVPLSLRGEEALEAVRYFSAEAEGQEMAVRLAEQGRQWANKALRNDDFEVWFFRLLLEYGRLVDDNRNEIGYAGS